MFFVFLVISDLTGFVSCAKTLDVSEDKAADITLKDVFAQYRIVIILAIILYVVLIMVCIHIIRLNKKHEAQLVAEENNISLQQKRYKILIDHSEELIYEISLKGDNCTSSDKILKKFGWEIPDRVDSLSIRTLCSILHVHPEDMEQFYSSTEGLVANKQSRETIIRLMKANGTYIWCKVMYYPLLDGNNEMVSFVGKIEDIDEEIKEKELLEKKSRTDGLTGLINKRTFQEDTVKYLVSNSTKYTSLIFVDMDFFKNVNDSLGHMAGDYAIKETAEKLQVIFANCDLVSRFGGDEYCVFVKNIPVETLIDKLNFAIEKLKGSYTNGQVVINMTASIGAAYCTQDNVPFTYMMEMADKALYDAKANGRNQFIVKYI